MLSDYFYVFFILVLVGSSVPGRVLHQPGHHLFTADCLSNHEKLRFELRDSMVLLCLCGAAFSDRFPFICFSLSQPLLLIGRRFLGPRKARWLKAPTWRKARSSVPNHEPLIAECHQSIVSFVASSSSSVIDIKEQTENGTNELCVTPFCWETVWFWAANTNHLHCHCPMFFFTCALTDVHFFF